jgi:anaerobic sulfite reductase subunit B
MAFPSLAEAPLAPSPARVVRRVRETADTWTLELEPAGGLPLEAAPGQFTMLYAFGIGEVPISISGLGDRLVHTVRAVGPVTRAICAARSGVVLGVRGPYGNKWPVELAEGADVVVVAGGIGLAPLRPVVHRVLAGRAAYGRACLLYGGRTPADLLYRRELERWRSRLDFDVDVTVDAAGSEWHGKVGLVTQLIPRADFDPASAVAFVCGPEIMMRFVARALVDRGLPRDRIYVSMERNMRCGVGLCGHCQVGPTLICRDGPVYRYDEIEPLLAVREL